MPRNKLALLIAIALLHPWNAYSKAVSFGSRQGMGIGPVVGITNNPYINYIPEPLSYKSSYTPYYGLQSFFDFDNWAIQPGALMFSHPTISGSGSNYTEGADATTFVLQLRAVFIPVYFKSMRQRLYFGSSLGAGYTYITDNRKYTTGKTYTERLKGGAEYFTGFFGFETFLVQNWASAIELGYRSFYIDNLKYRGNTDSSGATQTQGTEKQTSTGRLSFFSFRGFYSQISFLIHF